MATRFWTNKIPKVLWQYATKQKKGEKCLFHTLKLFHSIANALKEEIMMSQHTEQLLWAEKFLQTIQHGQL